jgi:hypothetical protein
MAFETDILTLMGPCCRLKSVLVTPRVHLYIGPTLFLEQLFVRHLATQYCPKPTFRSDASLLSPKLWI